VINIIAGFDFFGLEDGAICGSVFSFPSYNKIELSNSVVDNVYVTNDLTVTNTTTKPTQWGYYDVLNCEFEENLEGGSVEFNNSIIDHIQIQRRLASDLLWEVLATIDYISGTSELFNLTDIFIQNNAIYQYAMVPVSNGILGNQVLDPNIDITIDFDSTFLTDSTYNYQFLHDGKFDSITSNTATAILEPLDSQYPIVITNSLNYRSGRFSATLVSTYSINGTVNINQEYQLRQIILAFLNNKQPKLIRSLFGDNLLIMITDKPQITFLDGNIGIASVSFGFTEIGDGTDLTTLTLNGLVI
jgi:hypothetical protein